MTKLIVLMVFTLQVGVATVMAATLTGSVREKATGEALIQASVRLLNPADSSAVAGSVTSETGRYRIERVKAGRYIVEASYVGFTTQYRNITVGTDERQRIAPFDLEEGSIMLREAVVKGIRTPMKVMEDTVEYTADTYKTQPNAVVEDLLKRLPGVEVASDGKITANGKEVSKILVDGKEFFSDDPTVASRNLPVDMVDKLQVVDRKSDLARMTGVDDGEDETVINLTVKKDMKNGWFGNAEAGYGTDHRYRGNFNVNRFWNENQITFLGSANNINEPGFADGGSRFRRFGGTNGITDAQSAGINFNVGRGEIFRVGGDVMYSHTDRDTRTTQDRQYIVTGSESRSASSSTSRDRGHNVRADFRLQWKPDSFNTFEFRPNVSLNYNRSNGTTAAESFGNGGVQVTRSNNDNNSRGSAYEFGGRLIYNYNFSAHRGRSLSVMANYRMSNTREKTTTYSYTRYFDPNYAAEHGEEDIYDQYTNNRTWTNNVSTRLTWTEPLGNVACGHFLTLSYNFSYRWNNADKLTYRLLDDGDSAADDPLERMSRAADMLESSLVYDPDLSNRFRNDFMNQDIRVGYRHVTKATNLNVGLSVVPQHSKSINLIDQARNIERSVVNFAPFLRYRYKISRTRSINMFYNGRSSQPSMTQLQPVADVSDPQRIVIGNPDLKPSFNHFLNVRFQDFDAKAQRSIMAMIFANYTQNAIISATDFDPASDVQTTRYRNVEGVWNVRAMNMVSLPFRNRAWTFNNHLFLSYASNVGYSNGQRNRSGSFTAGESFSIAWRPDNLEFELRPNYRLQTVANTLQKGADRTVHTYGGTFYATYNIPVGIVVSTDLDYAATSGYSAGFDTRTWMWNASLSYQFLRGRNAAVTLKAYDILGQRSNVRRNVTANYIDDSRYNSLTRYVMLSFSYKFNTFGQGNTPRDRNAWGGPDGPPPGMRHGGGRPMGPPPGR